MSKEITIDIKKLPQSTAILYNDDMKDLFFQSISELSLEQKYEKATEFVYEHILRAYEKNLYNKNQIDLLLEKKYDKHYISQAIAKAWIDGDAQVKIQKISWFKRVNKRAVLLVVSICITLYVTFSLILKYRFEYKEVVSNMLMFEPVLAFLCVVLTWIIYSALKKVFRIGS